MRRQGMHKETPKRIFTEAFWNGGATKILEAPYKASDLKEQNQKGIG